MLLKVEWLVFGSLIPATLSPQRQELLSPAARAKTTTGLPCWLACSPFLASPSTDSSMIDSGQGACCYWVFDTSQDWLLWRLWGRKNRVNECHPAGAFRRFLQSAQFPHDHARRRRCLQAWGLVREIADTLQELSMRQRHRRQFGKSWKDRRLHLRKTKCKMGLEINFCKKKNSLISMKFPIKWSI